jgi:hypothetical protein
MYFFYFVILFCFINIFFNFFLFLWWNQVMVK